MLTPPVLDQLLSQTTQQPLMMHIGGAVTDGSHHAASLLLPILADDGGKSLLNHIQSGGPIGLVIIMLSFVAVALIVAHLVMVRLPKLAPPEVAERMHGLLRAGDVRQAVRFCQDEENDCFLTRVFSSALVRCSRSPFGFLELKTALEDAGREQVARLQRSTDGIGLIAAIAPMLGLLGTVVGMVGAFETISSTEGFAKPDQLAGNIATALITTVLGLIVAIPTTAVYTYFRNRIETIATEVAEIVEDIAAHLESGGAGPTGSAAPSPSSARPPQRPPAPAGPPAPAAPGATQGGARR